MKRKYPKKCPECNEFGEPVFEEGVGRSHQGAILVPNINQEPKSWYCPECKIEY